MIENLPWRAAALLVCAASLAAAQDPSRDYLTIETPHFRVSFTKPLEGVARRVAAGAERAYGQLSADLHPPRGTIDVLVTDDFDFANGSATPYPTNRIIVYAMPPVNDLGLRYTNDWAQLVVTHELAHIFHLDRARGIWRVAQAVFGRSPFLFPNAYQPSWVIEGLAVYEESRHAGQGRIEGPEHRLLARAALLDHRFPGIGDLSLANPAFPQGNSAYAYGSLFLDYLARTRGDSSIRKFVERSSAALIPYLIDLPAHAAFGARFGTAWKEWRASLDSAGSAASSMSTWRDLTGDQLVANYPRWLTRDSLTFTGNSGRDVLSSYTVTTDGQLTRGNRRNGVSPTIRLPNGDLLFAQYEYIGPYAYRSDLFVEKNGESPRRLTTGQRLFTPDARADGAIVAMQSVEGATRLVRVSADGATVTPITAVTPDTLWSEPRWSHRGDRLVASRWIRGGVAQIVTLDSGGANPTVLASGRRLMAAPSWAPDDSRVAFSLDGELWSVAAAGGDAANHSRVAFGVFEPAYRDAATLAGVMLRGGGYRVGLASVEAASGSSTLTLDTTPDSRIGPPAADSSPTRKYSALRQMIPRYWVPLGEASSSSGFRFGGYTEAWDILRRHYAYGEILFPDDNTGIVGALQYQYRGLGRPVLSFSASQDWDVTYAIVRSRTSPSVEVGRISRRIRDADVLATYTRQRVRSTLTLSAGSGVERREYVGTPSTVLAMVDSGGLFNAATFPRLTFSSTYARYQVPSFAVSPEDGFSFAVTARERLKSAFNATGGPSASIVSSLSLYKSLDLPGYAHHVLAGRVAGGWADTKSNSYYEIGGVSGGTYQVVPGYTIGEGRRTFPVRGFASGAVLGIRAVSASAEYRAPLWFSRRSASTLPTFLQRSSLTLFGDYGVAWCPSTLGTRQVCIDPDQEIKKDMASVGGELAVHVGILSWDSPTRLRFGFALPVHNAAPLGAPAYSFYFVTGVPF